MKNYNQIKFNLNRDNQIYEFLFSKWVSKRYFKKKGTLVDLGAGNGNNSLAFKKLGFDVTACDCDDSYFNRLKNKGVDCKKMNFEDKFPIKENSVDFIFAKSVIEHLNNPINFMKEANRVLQKGGIMFLRTPNWKKCMKRFYDDYTHKTPMTKNRIKELSENTGFKIIEMKNFRSIPYIWRFLGTLAFEFTYPMNDSIIAILEKDYYFKESKLGK